MPVSPSSKLDVLLSADVLHRRTRELARDVSRSHRDDPPVPIAVLQGARTFAEHLLVHLPTSPPLFGIRASSYGAGTVTSGSVRIEGGDDIPVKGKQLLLIEDIVDTGHTLSRLLDHFASRGAAGVQIVTLLNKPSRRVVPVELAHVGFEIPDRFVVGFGMDLDGRYRDLPHVSVLR